MKNNWEKIKKVIVILNDESVQECSEYKTVIETLGKEVSILVLSKKKEIEMNETLGLFVLTKKDFNLLGKPKSEKAQLIFKENFDLLLIKDVFEKKREKRILKIKAKQKIGFNLKERNHFLDININTKSNSVEHLINFTKEILEKII